MDKANSIKKQCAAVFALSFFFLMRTLLMVPEQFLGISVTEIRFTPSVRTVLMWILLPLFSVLAAAAAMKLQQKGGKAVSFLLILLIADPLFFTLQNNCLTLMISCFGLIAILNALREKPIIKKEIALCLFLFISAFLMPRSLFSYIPLAVMIYILANINSFCENAKKWVVLLPSFACVALGIVFNKLLCEKSRTVSDALRHLAFMDWEQTGSSRVLSLVAVPVLIFGLFYLSRYSKEQAHVHKNTSDGKYMNLPFDFFALGYILSAIGFVFFSSQAFLTANLVVPAMLITLNLSKRTAAERTTEIFNKGIQKHRLLAAIVFVLYCCFSYIMLNRYIQSFKLLYFAIEY